VLGSLFVFVVRFFVLASGFCVRGTERIITVPSSN